MNGVWGVQGLDFRGLFWLLWFLFGPLQGIMTTLRVRQKPRISVNKLGDYLTSTTASQRRAIIQAQREPKDFLVPRYKDAIEPLTRFLVTECRDMTILDGGFSRIEAKVPRNKWELDKQNNCMEALDIFHDIIPALRLGKKVIASNLKQHSLEINGVEVSVRPEVLIRTRVSADRYQVGAIKLFFRKTSPLSEQAAGYITTVLSEFMRQQFPDQEVLPDLCQVADVFGGRVFTTPPSTKKRMREVSFACEEIARVWHS
jgi:hypothetical protein